MRKKKWTFTGHFVVDDNIKHKISLTSLLLASLAKNFM